MRISIVTPSFNQAAFLPEAIESVLGQCWPDLEYLVVEGGSTDGSRQLARRYADRGRLTLIEFPGSRQAQAINSGFALATGEILAWLNSDDLYVGRAFAQATEAFARAPEAGVVYGHELSINAAGEVTGIRLAPPRLDRRAALWTGISIPQPAVFIHRRAYEAVGGLDERFDFALDLEYWHRLLEHFRFAHVPQVLAATRHHAHSKTGLPTGASSFGPNAAAICREAAAAFLRHGGRPYAPYYLQNRVNLYLKAWIPHRILSRLIRLYGHLTHGPRPQPFPPD